MRKRSTDDTGPAEYRGRLQPRSPWPVRLIIAALVAMVRVYQVTLSPLLGPACRFVPSCSEYFIQALREHGLLRGLGLGLWRLMRCQPFCRGGYDPVPPRR